MNKEGSPIEERSIPEPNSGCWIWLGDLSGRGYGRYQGTGAHRVSYELEKGPIPEGLVIDHLCRNTMCVNPSHLEAVTPRENTVRGIGPTAINSKKTHCVHGHELNAGNTIIRVREGRERRECMTCQYQMVRNWKERQKTALSVKPQSGSDKP